MVTTVSWTYISYFMDASIYSNAHRGNYKIIKEMKGELESDK
ncbi:MAG TPA: hypothetical protein VMW01_17255 [Williamwhitmania sp.]|nr:hypothetical protein [Williamwhitmania sp.]